MMGEDNITRLDANRVSFTGEISGSNITKLLILLTECIKEQPLVPEKPTVYLHIQSEGGCLYSGLRAYDNIKAMNKRCNIVTVAEGLVASAATLMFLGGSRRLALPSAWFLCHQLSTSVSGKNSLIQDEAKNCKLLMKQLIGIYARETELTNAQIKKLIERETNISANRARRWGFVTSFDP